MCGRYTLVDPGAIAAQFPQFRFDEFSESRLPRFNIAPTQDVLAVRNDGRHRIEPLRWGFLPPRSTGVGFINARAESLAAKPSFRDAYAHRRCAIFADGFYEWASRRPVRFTLHGGRAFAFAGIWTPPTAATPPTCAIVTCAANALVRRTHDRMPVILPDAALPLWLAAEPLDPADAAAILRPYDARAMEAHGASMRLNDARHDAPDVLSDDAPTQTTLRF